MGAARRISDLYARRFDIEEFFRDGKSQQFGRSLGMGQCKNVLTSG